MAQEKTPFQDDSATWIYWTSLDFQEQEIPEEWVWERLRKHRNSLLSDCDYRMVNDAPWVVTEWAKYRQELRDLPKKTTNPKLADWPVAPSE